MTPELKSWLQRLLEIVDEMRELRGLIDAPSKYSISYLFGYIESALDDEKDI